MDIFSKHTITPFSLSPLSLSCFLLLSGRVLIHSTYLYLFPPPPNNTNELKLNSLLQQQGKEHRPACRTFGFEPCLPWSLGFFLAHLSPTVQLENMLYKFFSAYRKSRTIRVLNLVLVTYIYFLHIKILIMNFVNSHL